MSHWWWGTKWDGGGVLGQAWICRILPSEMPLNRSLNYASSCWGQCGQWEGRKKMKNIEEIISIPSLAMAASSQLDTGSGGHSAMDSPQHWHLHKILLLCHESSIGREPGIPKMLYCKSHQPQPAQPKVRDNGSCSSPTPRGHSDGYTALWSIHCTLWRLSQGNYAEDCSVDLLNTFCQFHFTSRNFFHCRVKQPSNNTLQKYYSCKNIKC